jgi:short subunit dehydrogenase-like uncharacterized protein
MVRDKRNYDLVVWGATGFTGQLCAEHLAQRYTFKTENPLRWALAGRNREKLEAVKASLVRLEPMVANSVDILVADTNDQLAVDAVVCQARVIIALAGPFLNYGKSVVDACVRCAYFELHFYNT